MKHKIAKAGRHKGYGKNQRWPMAVKLWMAVVLANVIGVFVAVVLSRSIRNLPSSDVVETSLLVGFYATMGAVALVEAFWIDEVLFQGSFRITHFATVAEKKNKDNLDRLAATMRKSTLSFVVSALVTWGLSYVLFNISSGHFSDYYDRIGKHFSRLRENSSAEFEQKRDAIAALSRVRRTEITVFLLNVLERRDELAPWAAWAIGRQANKEHRSKLIEPLVTVARTRDPESRKAALIALGRLQHRAIAPALQKELTKELDSNDNVDVRLIWALGYVQVDSSLKVLERCLYHKDLQTQRVAAWAIAQHRDQSKEREAVKMLEERLPAASFPLKCAIVSSLGILQSESSNLALVHGMNTLSHIQQEQQCDRLELGIRPDGTGDDVHYLFAMDARKKSESYLVTTITALGSMRATTPAIRSELEPWLDTLAQRPNLGDKSQQYIQSLLEGIRKKRDDSSPN